MFMIGFPNFISTQSRAMLSTIHVRIAWIYSFSSQYISQSTTGAREMEFYAALASLISMWATTLHIEWSLYLMRYALWIKISTSNRTTIYRLASSSFSFANWMLSSSSAVVARSAAICSPSIRPWLAIFPTAVLEVSKKNVSSIFQIIDEYVVHADITVRESIGMELCNSSRHLIKYVLSA